MVTLHLIFKMTKKEYDVYKVKDNSGMDQAFYECIVGCFDQDIRVDIHQMVVKLNKKDKKSKHMIQYDLELEEADLDGILSNAESVLKHKYFDSIWRQGRGASLENGEEGSTGEEAKCHLKPVQPHGCTCAKHVKAWHDRINLLRCRTCKPAVQSKQEVKQEANL